MRKWKKVCWLFSKSFSGIYHTNNMELEICILVAHLVHQFSHEQRYFPVYQNVQSHHMREHEKQPSEALISNMVHVQATKYLAFQSKISLQSFSLEQNRAIQASKL